MDKKQPKSTNKETKPNKGKQGKRQARPRPNGEGPGNWNRQFASKSQKGKEDKEDKEDKPRCDICDNVLVYKSVTECHHVSCNVCMLRHRALYGKSSCIVCRNENSVPPIVVSQAEPDLYDEKLAKFWDHEYKIGFSSIEAQSATMQLLQNKCPFPDCETFDNFRKLSDHVKSVHEKFYCFLCAKFKKAFVSELPLYGYAQLKRHQKQGDLKAGFPGHPECQFCHKEMFYSDDELTVHMREKHEKCHLCDKLDPSKPKYFKNYDMLYAHFARDHFVCTVQSCLDQKFVAFEDELSLKAHMISEHSALVGNNRSLLGTSSGSSRSFESSLSTFTTEHVDSVETKRLRLEERARHYLEYDSEKFAEFVALNKRFLTQSDLLAIDVFEAYQTMFAHRTSHELKLLIQELTELVPEKFKSKRQDLERLANEAFKKEENEEKFPALGSTSKERPVWVAGGSTASRKLQSRREEQFPVLSGNSSASNSARTSRNNSTVSLSSSRIRTGVTVNAANLSRLQLSDSSAGWANSSNSSVSSGKKKLSASEDFPALEQDTSAPLKVNRMVRYKTLGKKSAKQPLTIKFVKHTSPGTSNVASSSSNSSSSSSSSINGTSTSWGPSATKPSQPEQPSVQKKGKKQVLFQMGI